MNAPVGSFGQQSGFNPLHPRYLPYKLDFSAVGSFNVDLQQQQNQGALEFVQSVWIDNSQNLSTLTLVFLGTGQIIIAQPGSQGDYPVKIGTGVIRFSATATPGQVIPVIFQNTPPQGCISGPVSGALIVPALTNLAVNVPVATIGDNVLVAGVVGQTIKVYRLFYTLGNAAIITLKDTAGAAWTGPLPTTAYGGAAFQATGVPWFVTGVGAGLVMNSNAAISIGGALGYVQS